MTEPWHKNIITEEELAHHNVESDAWIRIDNTVYDVSKFHMLHPGGSKVLSSQAGTDASKLFFGLHRHEVLETWAPKLAIGRIAAAKDIDPADDVIRRCDISTVPYSEQMSWTGFDQPHYYKESHKRYRSALRKWVYKELITTNLAENHEESGEKPPDELFEKMGKLGILAARLGPGSNLETWRFSIAPPETNGQIFGVEIEDFDYFHEAITHEELGRCACPGFTSGLGDGLVIGLPPVVQFGPEWMKEKVIPDVLSGKSRICLAISEPEGGSDVAGIHTTAEKTADGKHYIVNGTKKWITQGHHSKYFVTAVRTGDPALGMGSISLLLLDRYIFLCSYTPHTPCDTYLCSHTLLLLLNRNMEGLRTKAIKTSYSSAAGTALVIMEDVLVPVENLLGTENGGFMCIMVSNQTTPVLH
jgi:alkylation response protein AidB-like acyl-CoA dehydrogenase/predicted heme/steroid binding protein